jgi:hypothetical protein
MKRQKWAKGWLLPEKRQLPQAPFSGFFER